jgi:hypothetical protein
VPTLAGHFHLPRSSALWLSGWVALLAALVCLIALRLPLGGSGAAAPAAAAPAISDLGGTPLSFAANRGQSATPVKFLAQGAGYGIFLTPRQAVLGL